MLDEMVHAPNRVLYRATGLRWGARLKPLLVLMFTITAVAKAQLLYPNSGSTAAWNGEQLTLTTITNAESPCGGGQVCNGQYSGTFGLSLSGPTGATFPLDLINVTIPVQFSFPFIGSGFTSPQFDSGTACATVAPLPTNCHNSIAFGPLTVAQSFGVIVPQNSSGLGSAQIELPVTLTTQAVALLDDESTNPETFAEEAVTVDFGAITLTNDLGTDVTNQFTIAITAPPGTVLTPEPDSMMLAAAALLVFGVRMFPRAARQSDDRHPVEG